MTDSVQLVGRPTPGGDAAATDGALVERWLAGDDRAATALVERHSPSLARFAASLGMRDEIEETVQDTFVRAFQSLRDFRGDSSLRTWLLTIERRLVLDRRRTERRRRNRETGTAEDALTTVTALDGLVAEETARAVHAAVRRLSPMQRQVFLLRVTEGLSYKEIAEVIGTTDGAARVHYFNAVRTIKERLDG